MSDKTKKKPKSSKAASAASNGAATGSPQAPSQPATPPPGLDQAKHAKAQRAAKGAELLREAVFPALMASALGFEKFVETAAFKTFLERFMSDLGNPKDPLERMLGEQLAFTHFRIAQIHVDAAQAKSLEAMKLYNTVCARLLGEFRRSVLTLRALRTPPTAEGRTTKVRLFKMAQ